MKKLISFILLFTVINCSGQVSQVKDTLGVRPIIDNKVNPIFYSISRDTTSILQVKMYKPSFRIDSTYLQLIIQELERHGYTLVKLPKKQ